MKQELISVIIPTFDEASNIKRLLLSIQKQSYKKYEVIVVDDGSHDQTVSIAKRFTQKVYPRKHAERSVQRNFGATKAKGKYLFFLDADMELTQDVLQSCIDNMGDYLHLVVPEKTVGRGFMSAVRAFERSMYVNDLSIEVARFFKKEVFIEMNGYDVNLTGTEDYDLPKRIMNKYGVKSLGRAKEWILHHEAQRTLFNQLKRKFYYARKSYLYTQKHPDLIWKQGNLIFRKAYFKNWKKFIQNPVLGTAFIFVRVLETVSAIGGYISAVGVFGFIKTIVKSLFVKSNF